MKITRSTLSLAIALTVQLVADACAKPQSIVREQKVVNVAAGSELWRLEWHSPPASACGPTDPAWSTCSCQGFEFAELASLDLVRARAGHRDERLTLDTLFVLGENPATWQQLRGATLPGWPVRHSDDMNELGESFAKRVFARPRVQIMQLGDYDHDGHATEFLLQIGTTPCGHNETVVVGISGGADSLHAFTSIAHPERPLILEARAWRALLAAHGPVAVTEVTCGDHASENEMEVLLDATPRGIDAQMRYYSCVRGKRGKLDSSEAY